MEAQIGAHGNLLGEAERLPHSVLTAMSTLVATVFPFDAAGDPNNHPPPAVIRTLA